MADIAWSAYALAMFTPEERAAATAAVPDPGFVQVPVPLPGGGAPGSSGLPVRITGPGIPVTGWDPNNPNELRQILALGWRFEGGSWIAPGSPGVVATPDQVQAGRGPTGSLSSVQSQSAIPGGSVLGYVVPAAPPVLLPQWVGGRVGRVVVSGGTRPESGGTPLVKRGSDVQWARVRR